MKKLTRNEVKRLAKKSNGKWVQKSGTNWTKHLNRVMKKRISKWGRPLTKKELCSGCSLKDLSDNNFKIEAILKSFDYVGDITQNNKLTFDNKFNIISNESCKINFADEKSKNMWNLDKKNAYYMTYAVDDKEYLVKVGRSSTNMKKYLRYYNNCGSLAKTLKVDSYKTNPNYQCYKFLQTVQGLNTKTSGSIKVYVNNTKNRDKLASYLLKSYKRYNNKLPVFNKNLF